MRADERGKWLNWFTKDNIPEWECPSCQRGVLKIEGQDALLSWFTGDSEGRLKSEYFGFDDARLYCKINYDCSSCAEKIVAIGEGRIEHDDEGFVSFYRIKNFHHSPRIIKIPDAIRYSTLAIAIEQSFDLYWLDEASCVNKIRVAIEMLLDAIEPPVPRRSADLKARRLNLHERLVLLGETDEGLKKRLLAIKWLGNAGSHESDISRLDLLDAYIILEHVLYDRFEREHKEKEVNALANSLDQKYSPSAMQ